MDGKIFFYDCALGAAFLRTLVDLFSINSFHQDQIFARKGLQDSTRLAFIFTRQNYYVVSLFYMHDNYLSDYTTSGAKEIIFWNPASPISLGTGPKTRPASGSFLVLS